MNDQKDPVYHLREERRRRQVYDGAFKARIVFQLISREKTLSELASQYGIHPNQIKNWKSILFKEASMLLDDKRCSRPRH
ncbi:MAG: hypothetical protein CSYNP_01485 [Syntrophus sp. SKADARSKE-3]|nr:hypothetical protein [Syntrophus sp. SKADARSKE-3]